MSTAEMIQGKIKEFHEAQQKAARPSEAQKGRAIIKRTEGQLQQATIALGVAVKNNDAEAAEVAREDMHRLQADLEGLNGVVAAYESGALEEPVPEGPTPGEVAEEIHTLIGALLEEMRTTYDTRVDEAMAAKQAYLNSLGAIHSAELDIGNLGLLYHKIRPFVAVPFAQAHFSTPGLWSMAPGVKPLASRFGFEEDELFRAYAAGATR